MGYTHYWRCKPKLPARKWAAAVADCQTLLTRLQAGGLPLFQDYDEPGTTPSLDAAEIRFNGVDADGHETFLVERVAPATWTRDDGVIVPLRLDGGMAGTFCKTARKPYDLAVCGCLVVLAHHFGPAFTVTSDGDDDEENWPRARALCDELFGYGTDFTAATPPPRLTARGLLPVRRAASPKPDCSQQVVLADGTVLVVYRRDYRRRDDQPVATGGYVLQYRPRPFGTDGPYQPGYDLVPYGRVRVESTGYPRGRWFAASVREAGAETTKQFLRATLWKTPGADLFLPGVLHTHPELTGLGAWDDWLSEQPNSPAVVAGRRLVAAVRPKPRVRRLAAV